MIKTLFHDFYSPLVPGHKRIFLIDLLRFVAIILMVFFHFCFDLTALRFQKFDFSTGFFYYLPRVIVTLFLLSSGLSLGLSSSKKGLKKNFQKYSPRILKIGFFAGCISLITYLLYPANWIYFGILHHIAVATLLACFIKDYRGLCFFIGAAILVNYFSGFIPFEDPMYAAKTKALDLIQLYPWIGVFLLGLGLSQYIERLNAPLQKWQTPGITVVSQKSLPIYLLHQPIMFGILFLISQIL